MITNTDFDCMYIVKIYVLTLLACQGSKLVLFQGVYILRWANV